MKEENKTYITGLDARDVPWHRLTTAYGRGTDFPVYFETLSKMDDLKTVKNALCELTTNMEHQSTLWHATPFGMIFMSRILVEALNKSKENPIANLTGELLDFFLCILQCYHDGDEMEHAAPLLCFSDMLKEEYLWSKEYDEEEDEMRYEEDEVFPDDLFYSFYYYSWQADEEDEVFPDDLFYSFYYYSWQAVLAYRGVLEREVSTEFGPKIAEVLERL